MSSFTTFESPPLVIDNGSGVIKVGISGQAWPTAEVPNVIGHAKHKRALLTRSRGENSFGQEALLKRGLYKISRPMKGGVIVDEHGELEMWEYIYKDVLSSSAMMKQHPVLLTEAPNNPVKNRRYMAQTFFEAFEVPGLFFAPSPVLAMYATGRLTGCVLDSGHGVSQCVPIYDGFALPHAVTRMDVAGHDVDGYFQLLLRRLSGVTFHTSAERELVRDIKERHCEIMPSAPSDSATGGVMSKKISRLHSDDESIIRVELPDKKELQLGSARWKAPELLFDPSLIGLEYRGLQYSILDSIAKCDMDLRRGLGQQILLSGGSTMYKGFGARLLNELKACSGLDAPKFKIFAPKKRNLTSWAGGSVLSSLQSFNPMWITREEYLEEGPRIIHTKTFL
jgi:centractin